MTPQLIIPIEHELNVPIFMNWTFIVLSECPSGLKAPATMFRPFQRMSFWSPNGGVGWNPTSDKNVLETLNKNALLIFLNIIKAMKHVL